ncbi:MAG: trypsin-like peptidase domain-containing protein [Anaerolineae bacterium]|nr:trypsin-like peptidase domain-containing protein [Anaerolineae bacterium]
MGSILSQLNEALAGVAASVLSSLVEVSTGRGGGAGTIWHSDGLIITNAHVVSRGDINVRMPNGNFQPAQLLAYDPNLDLAALAVEAHDLPTIELGKSKELRPGQFVTAIGHPWGVHGAATSGVVIGTGSDELPEMITGREWVMVSLHLRPGHSGGPLVDAHARLVGINTIMTGPDVGGAVPVDVVKRFLKNAL